MTRRMKRSIANIVIALGLTAGLCYPAFGQQMPSALKTFDFTIMGVGLNASPEYQAVPKGIASRVDTVWTSGGSVLPAEIVKQLPSGLVVKAELTGPAYQTPIQLATYPGQPFDLPTLPLLGKYTLSNIRVYDSTGTVLVRNPNFTVTLGHPATIRSGEEYDLYVTITNTSLAVANLVSVHLDQRALSGTVFVGGENPDKHIETILPGSSETIKYRLLSQRTGAVTATAFASETMKGRFILRVGVGELGIPLSPDSLIIPYTGELAPDLVTAAVGLLGQAWSVATAPTGALPATVLPISESTITARANDLSEAGLRILMGDTAIKAAHAT